MTKRPYRDYVDPATFGAWLTAERSGLGWTQATLAAQLGVNVYTVGDWEREHRAPSLTNLHLIAAWAGVPLARLAQLVDDQLAGPQVNGATVPVHPGQLSIADGGA